MSSSPLSKTPSYKHWKRIGICAHHGMSVPLSALRSQMSCGIGEFTDLPPMFNWLKKVHMDMIQILPINDSGVDISPYNAISGFALSPIFLGLAHLPHVKTHPALTAMITELQSYNTLPKVAYRQVTQKKYIFLHLYFSLYFAQFRETQKYRSFLRKEKSWLQPYALFKSLKEKFHHTAWWTWPISYQFLSNENLQKLSLEHQNSMHFYSFIQFLCMSQLKAAKQQAETSHILLQGDIPFLFNRDSIEVWSYPSLFDFRYTIGSPPNKANPGGQNWGFPTYKWTTHEKNIFLLWKSKLQFAENFYHCYRIDHAIGLYRIWRIPVKAEASKGAFFPKLPSRYIKQGHARLLRLLTMTKMLPIAEDLGADIYAIRNDIAKIGIPGTRVIRWEHMENYRYIPINLFSSCSLTTLSTHDTTSLSLWWIRNQREARAYAKCRGWKYSPTLSTSQRYEILRDAHSSASLLHVNPIQEYLSFFQELSHPNLKDDQINIPGTTEESNWTYRCKPSIEELYTHAALNEMIKKVINI